VARPPESLATERLVLHRPRLDDAEAIFVEYARDPEVTRYVRWRPPVDVGQTRQFLERCLAGWDSGDEPSWAITRKGADRRIGMIACRIRGHAVEVGYVMARAHSGQGYMTEAARAVVRWASALDGVHRVWALCDTANVASARVMEKAGMTREGVLRRWAVHPNVAAEPRDCYAYSLVRGAADQPTGARS
jgi:RimJ/RimL family protein N-acetyltransferase